MRTEILERTLSIAAAVAAIISASIMMMQAMQASQQPLAENENTIQPCVLER